MDFILATSAKVIVGVFSGTSVLVSPSAGINAELHFQIRQQFVKHSSSSTEQQSLFRLIITSVIWTIIVVPNGSRCRDFWDFEFDRARKGDKAMIWRSKSSNGDLIKAQGDLRDINQESWDFKKKHGKRSWNFWTN